MTHKEKTLARAEKGASLVLIGGGVVALTVFLYLLYQYRFSGQRQFAIGAGALWYLVFPAAASAVLFASVKLKRAYRISSAVGLLGFTSAAYGVEAYLNVLQHARFSPDRALLNSQPQSQEAKQQIAQFAKRFGVEVDTRDYLEVIEDLAKRGIEAVPQIILPIFEEHNDGRATPGIRIDGAEVMPLSGISNRTTVVCNQNGDYLTYISDERGFHNPKGRWQSSNLEFAAVGNSFTMGYCVASDKNYVALMRERYPDMLNLGMAGEGPLHILAVLQEYLEPLKPKRVLWFYFEGNNLGELQHEKRSALLMRYLQDGFSQGLRARQSDIDQALLAYAKAQTVKDAGQPRRRSTDALGRVRDIVKLSRVRTELGLVYGRTQAETEAASATNLTLFRDILARAQRRVESWGGKIYFVYLPGWDRYAQNVPGIGAQQRAKILTYAYGLGITVVDLLPAFSAQADPLSLFPFRRPGHYNEKGHRLVADEVLKAIPQRGHGVGKAPTAKRGLTSIVMR